ncbi:hypothetical protein [Streptomyces sp. NPDC056544]|uniref:hypothetical protein n=1 Tax=unclassified Streptomyces TaxID=2593676 RepID=UPI0036B095B7
MRPIRLTSFGYLHLPTGPDGTPVPPAADRIEDVRDRLRDPAAALDLDGLNPRVQDAGHPLRQSSRSVLAACQLIDSAMSVGFWGTVNRSSGRGPLLAVSRVSLAGGDGCTMYPGSGRRGPGPDPVAHAKASAPGLCAPVVSGGQGGVATFGA